MDALHIGTMENRYYLPPKSSAAQERLDALAGSQLAEAIAAALEAAGVRPSEEICIRELHAPVAVDLERSDVDLGRVWANAIVAFFQAELVTSCSTALVRYPSRAAAWVDCAAAVAAGDTTRLWAWRQLGLLRAGESAGPNAAAAALGEGLLREPERIVPTLAAVAAAGRLPRLLGLWDPDTPLELAKAAFERAGGEPAVLALAEADSRRDTDRDSEHEPLPTSTGLGLAAATLLTRLETAAALGLALLAWLEQEPELGRRPRQVVRRRLQAVASATGGWNADRRAEPPRDSGSTGREANGRGALLRAARPDRGNVAGDGSRETLGTNDQRIRFDRRPATSTAPARGDGSVRARGEAEEPAASELPESAPVEAASRARVTGETSFGGLLFLLRVLDERELFARLLEASALRDRPLRWSLHLLALRLALVAAEDPAALAFAGLLPNAVPPSRENAPHTPEELESVDRVAREVVAAVAARLGDTDRPAGAVLEELCRRRATIEADPGWIDVCLGFNEVSTAVRRCGLDLDPGYLPWLGIVVRFVYV